MPSAHNSPGFTSFSDYLNANAGSLDAERNAALAGATAAGDKAQGDLTKLGTAAWDRGAQDATGHGPFDPHSAATAPGFDPTTLGGYSQFLTDRQSALDAADSLNDPSRAADKYSPFESGLVNASSDYQGKAKGLQDQYGKAFDNYLGSLGQGYQQGYVTHMQFSPLEGSAAPTSDPGNTASGATDDSGIDRATNRYPTGGDQPSTQNEDPYGASWGGGG